MAAILFLDGPVSFTVGYATTCRIASAPFLDTASETGQKL
jgi:hypothetical protein